MNPIRILQDGIASSIIDHVCLQIVQISPDPRKRHSCFSSWAYVGNLQIEESGRLAASEESFVA